MLAERIRAGEGAAFESMFVAYYAGLLTYATRCTGARDIAEDLVQSTFADLWARRETFRPAVSVRVTLYAAVRYRLLTHARGTRRAARAFASYGVMQEPPDTEVRSLDEQQALHDALDAVLPTLSERARETLELRYGRGLSIREVAEVMGISVNTVKTQLARGLAALRKAAEPFR